MVWSSSTKSEVFDTKTGTRCQNLPPFPIQIDGAIGETINNVPVLCGGYLDGSGYQKSCYALRENNWSKIGDMRKRRYSASSLLLGNNTLWIMGGFNGYRLESTELMEFKNGAITAQRLGPDLPLASVGHCSIRISDTKAIILGGSFGTKTYFNGLQSGTWTEGPSLQDSGDRRYAACGIITDIVTKNR